MDMFAGRRRLWRRRFTRGTGGAPQSWVLRAWRGLQLVLALGALAGSLRRIVGDATPVPIGMMGIAACSRSP